MSCTHFPSRVLHSGAAAEPLHYSPSKQKLKATNEYKLRVKQHLDELCLESLESFLRIHARASEVQLPLLNNAQ